jgi:uncharacterized protein (TIGR02217 family)
MPDYGKIIQPSAASPVDYGQIATPAASGADYGTIADIFPDLPGMTFVTTRTPVWSTLEQVSASGKRVGYGLWSYPRWKWVRQWDQLKSDDVEGSFQTLVGFFNAHRGMLIPFFYRDEEDRQVAGQLIGHGTGAQTAFQVQRTLTISYMPSTEPVKAVDGTPVIYLDGEPQTSGWTVDGAGVLRFDSPPAFGALIEADFSYLWRVTFAADEYDFDKLVRDWWVAKKVELISLK